MAEALAVVGLVSNIIQFVELGSELTRRLSEFKSSYDQVPETFQALYVQLPLLIDSLERMKAQADQGFMSEQTARTLQPAITGCLSQIRKLEYILRKTEPAKGDSNWRRRIKALSSLSHDKEVEQVTAKILSYVPLLTFSQSTTNADILRELQIRERQEWERPSQATSEPPPRSPKFMVPFSRADEFIGREEILGQVKLALNSGNWRAALVGIGGAGKSQIAVEFCYRHHQQHPEAHVFWVYASDVDHFEKACKEIAQTLGVPGQDDPDADALQLVSEYLSDDKSMPWLLVLDNADDQDVVFGAVRAKSSPAVMLNFLLRGSKGSILATTRDRRVGVSLTGDGRVFDVSSFNQRDAVSLLRNKLMLAEKQDEDECLDLVRTLEFLPLAIAQAAAFIKDNHITTGTYLELLRESDDDMKDLLSEGYQDMRRRHDGENSVFKTWKISFDLISKQTPRAAAALSLMALLDRQGIPQELLRDDDDRKVAFIKALGTLKAFSLVTEEKGGAVYGMHRLVQLSTQRWLEMKGTLPEWREKALEVVSKNCRLDVQSGNLATWRAIMPHIQAVLRYPCPSKQSRLSRANILYREAWYRKEMIQYDVAYAKLTEAIEIRKSESGPDCELTLKYLHALAMLYDKMDQPKRAEETYMLVLERKREVLGADHVSTMDTLHQLGNLYRGQERFEDAEATFQQALSGKVKLLGEDHISSIHTMHQLGTIYRAQERYADAEEIYLQALAGKEKWLGPNNVSVAQTLHQLGTLYREQNKLAGAESMYTRALRIKEAIDGPDGPDGRSALDTVHRLGTLYKLQGKDAEAERFYQRAVKGKTQVYGPDHLQTLDTVDRLAELYYAQGNLDAAEAMWERVLTGRQTKLGMYHNKTMETASRLHGLRIAQGGAET